MKKAGIVIFIMLLSLVGCSSMNSKGNSFKNENSSNKMPNWVFNSTLNGKYKLAGIGVSKRTIDGTTRQREIAISRAIDEISKQMGIKVSNRSLSHATKSESSFEQYSLQTVEGKTVNAVINGMWYNKDTGELYIWMVVK
ncbi:hypothetical protein [Haliovirga abyssi]|uniref:Lipoprotein n=1 Tax=Haliovirga abyssi TaxID=2996794 RepID=A0AAU9DZP8_9FUSO|nr:hypothetical protein [Haliovirga abyssi]BDU51050.1 hypothetical protein HLVA_16190 [Haliovirga abyssi]